MRRHKLFNKVSWHTLQPTFFPLRAPPCAAGVGGYFPRNPGLVSLVLDLIILVSM